jgi:hypothetical protein
LCGVLQAAANSVEVAAVGRGSAIVGLVSEMPELRFLDITWLNLEPWELRGLAQMKQLHYLGLGKQQVGVLTSQEAQFGSCLRRSSRSRGRGRSGGGLFGTLGGWFGWGGRSNARRAESTAAAGQGFAGGGTAASAPAVNAAAEVGGGRASAGWLGWLFAPVWRLCWLLWWCCAGLCGLLFGRVWLLLPDAGGFRLGPGAAAAASRGGGAFGGSAWGVKERDGAGWLEGGPAMVLVEAPAGFDEVIERDVMTSASAAD